MEPPALTPEIALRIGLAARTLPSTSVGELLDALHVSVGETLDHAALMRITVTNLKESLKGTYNLDGEEDGAESPRSADIAAFKDAVRILWGETTDEHLPTLDTLAEGEMPVSIRIAVASNEGEMLDGHFGSCLRFLVYQVAATGIKLVDIRPTLLADASGDKNGARVELIRDCQVVYVVSVGGPASAKIIKADIHIVQHPQGGEARGQLSALQQVIGGTPPPWLAKRLGIAADKRVKLYRAASGAS
ncbi:MAG: hypothetical protein RL385_2639 [Pseudomonadota bacterium]|jgi:nitrogen fixation protein NifX